MNMSIPRHRSPARHAARLALFLLFTLIIAWRPVAAQSILRDAETEALLQEMTRPLVEASGLQADGFEVILINNPSINAFVAGGQRIYIHSGLFVSADNANEVQGVLAHELGHVEGGHVLAGGDAARQATNISLLSLLLGAAAIAAGAPEAGIAAISGGSRAALGSYLSFSREQESRTDLAGARYLSRAGISGRGSLAFFRRLQNQEYRLNISQSDGSYERTHPLNRERLAILTELYENDPAWNTPTDPALEARFQRVRAKLFGFVSEPRQTLVAYPESDQSIPGRYARAYAWHQDGYPQRAMTEANSLIESAPDDPYFRELRGQILLESGRPDDALPDLRIATERSGNSPLIASLLGHALIATEDESNHAEARQVLRVAVQRDNRNPFAWYQLGVIYEQDGDTPRAQLATAERFSLQGVPQRAMVHACQAMLGIPDGSVDWLRAQDILLVSQAEIQQSGNRRQRRERRAAEGRGPCRNPVQAQ